MDPQHLKLAFVLDHLRRIVEADGKESFAEYQLQGEIFPRPLLREAGFLDDDDALTPRFEAAKDEAARALPTLDASEKDEIFVLLYAACEIDGIAESELPALHEAGRALGIPDIDQRIERLRAAASDQG